MKNKKDLTKVDETLSRYSSHKKQCQSCGEDFTTVIPWAKFCRPCAGSKAEQQAKAEAEAKALAEEKAYRIMVASAKIPLLWQNTRFENSDPTIHCDAFKATFEYAKGFSTKSKSLILYSRGYGTGKTHLAICVANHLLHSRRIGVLFQKARDLHIGLRAIYQAEAKTKTEEAYLDRILSMPLLILDDLGLDRPSEWVISNYWTIFDRRMERELPVVVTTNYPPQLDGLGDRIGDGAMSRLLAMADSKIIELEGEDLR